MGQGASPDWITPPALLRAAADLWAGGCFDLDPCASDNFLHDPAVVREQWRKRDGKTFAQWHGKVWLNPPYGSDELINWLRKARNAINAEAGPERVVALLPVRSDTTWWHAEVMRATGICLLRGRVRFLEGRTGQPAGSPAFASAIVIFDRDHGAGPHAMPWLMPTLEW